MSLANVLACAPAARSLILLGDPQQLEQLLQRSHPEGSEVSALYHLLGGADTMPPEQGLFRGETYRLHPDIARFTSEIYYEGAAQGGSRPRAPGDRVEGRPRVGPLGLRPPVPAGRARREPGARARRDRLHPPTDRGIAGGRRLAGPGRPRAAAHGARHLIVAPYNAQVSALTEAVPALADRIGTVDRFQGQEAPVVIYSMTSSSPGDTPRGMEFLYNRFRFNVATSRARALCVLVGSPALFAPDCRTPRQMRMANGLCRFRELARTI